MTPPRLLVILITALVWLLAPLRTAWAQGTPIPPEIVGKSDLAEADREKIRNCVEMHIKGLTGEPQDLKRDRNALLEPLHLQKISVQFRLEYTNQLIGTLKPMAADKNEVWAVNALRICGELATAKAADVMADALKDKRPGVRYAAASGFQQTFYAMEQTVPALGSPTQALKLLDGLKAALQSETDPRVMEGLVLALQQAMRIPTKQMEGMRDAAVKALCQAISAKLKAARPGFEQDAALRRAIQAIRSVVTNPANVNEPDIADNILREDAAGLAGDLLALAYNRIKDGVLDSGAKPKPEDEEAVKNWEKVLERRRADLTLMVSEAEQTVFFIEGKHQAGGVQPQIFKLKEMVEQSKDQDFLKAVMQVIGPNGVLTDRPKFPFADDRFVK